MRTTHRLQISLKQVKYTRLPEVPDLAASLTVTAGRRVRWIRIWQQELMLVKNRDSRSRLFRAALLFPYIHIGQHWRAGSRCRWNTVMSSRFSVRIGAGTAKPSGLAPGTSTELCVVRRMVGFYFRMILKDNCCKGI